MISLDDVLQRLEDVTGFIPRAHGKGFEARCPSHSDSSPSLSVAAGDKGILITCHAGCDFRSIATALGYEPRELFWESNMDAAPRPPPRPQQQRPRAERPPLGKHAATYDYRDESGALLYRVKRYEGDGGKKTFLQFKADGTAGIDGVRRVLYRLPEVIAAAKAGRTVFIGEGEKVVHRLLEAGLDATTSSGGAKGQLPADLAQVLAGADVVILPDHDGPGLQYAKRLALELEGKARVRIVDLPGLSDGEDAVEWFARGHTVEELLELAAKAEASREAQPSGERDDVEPTGAQYHLTERGMAQRLVALHGRDLRFCHPWGKWLVWDGRRWAPDDTAEVVRRATATVASVYREAASEPKGSRRDELVAFAKRCESARAIAATLRLAESEPGVPVLPGDLDVDPLLLNVTNGTLDLRTGALREHRREDLITRVAPLTYDATASCPKWRAFLTRIFAGDADLIRFVQKAAGYALTGDVSEQVLFFAYGTGANGKTVFLRVLMALLGEYAVQAPPSLLIARHHESHPTELARLFGKRLAVCTELEHGSRLAEARTKALTGSDPVPARRMREDWWTFTPTHKLWIVANHRPEILGTDEGIWRRQRMLPFTVTIPEGERNPHLTEDLLEEEGPGIARWLVEGCTLWRREGLRAPGAVEAATAEYRAEQDAVSEFLATRCIVQPLMRVPKTDLRKAYEEWARNEGLDVLTPAAFRTALLAHGIADTDAVTHRPLKGAKGIRLWRGLRLQHEHEAREDLEAARAEAEEAPF